MLSLNIEKIYLKKKTIIRLLTLVQMQNIFWNKKTVFSV